MGKKQDIMWEQSTLWESVEKWVTKYLKKNHSEYRELQVKAMRIVDENPALRILINNMEGIALTPEDHKALHKYIETKDEMTIRTIFLLPPIKDQIFLSPWFTRKTLLFPAHLYSDRSISLELLSVFLSDSLNYLPEKTVIMSRPMLYIFFNKRVHVPVLKVMKFHI